MNGLECINPGCEKKTVINGTQIGGPSTYYLCTEITNRSEVINKRKKIYEEIEKGMQFRSTISEVTIKGLKQSEFNKSMPSTTKQKLLSPFHNFMKKVIFSLVLSPVIFFVHYLLSD